MINDNQTLLVPSFERLMLRRGAKGLRVLPSREIVLSATSTPRAFSGAARTSAQTLLRLRQGLRPLDSLGARSKANVSRCLATGGTHAVERHFAHLTRATRALADQESQRQHALGRLVIWSTTPGAIDAEAVEEARGAWGVPRYP